MNKNLTIKKQHIVMYIGSLQRGGAEHVMVNLAQYFYGRGYRVTLVTTYLEKDEYAVKGAAWKEVSEEDFRMAFQVRGEQSDQRGQSGRAAEGAIDKMLQPAARGADADAAGLGVVQLPASFETEDAYYARVLRPDDSATYVRSSKDPAGIHRVFTALLPEDRKGRVADFTARCNILRGTWEMLQPDLLLSFLGKNNVMALMTSMGMGFPVVVSVRSDPRREYKNKLLRFMMRSTFQNAGAVVVQTQDAKKYFKGKTLEHTVVLPNSLQPSFLGPIYEGEREKTVVTVGSLRRVKNQALLVRAFAKAVKEHPGYKLVIYGEGEERENLLPLAATLGIEDKVSLPGQISDVAEVISKAGIFVLSSDREGMPNALLEAMALGIPSISTTCPCGGPAELITDGVNGRLVPVGGEEELATALQEYMQNPGAAAQMGKKASAVQEAYAPEKVNGAWEELFISLMK